MEKDKMRLTKDVKTAILNAALKKAGIPEKKAAIRARYADWAEEVRQLHVTPEQIEMINKAREASNLVARNLKNQSFRPQEGIGIENANIAGQRRTVYFCGALTREERERSRGYVIAPESGGVTLGADNPLTEKLYAIDHDAKALKDETEQLTVSLWAVLNSVNTDKRLIEVWPEAATFIPVAERAAHQQLPALPIADLNRLIGLP